MRVALAGVGAFGVKHLESLQRIPGVEVAVLVDPQRGAAEEVARGHAVEEVATDLEPVLSRDDIDAVVLCTPTQLHAAQAIQVMRAGKHVQVEIPLADSWSEAQQVHRVQQQTGMVCMVGHTRRFNPPHQWLNQRFRSGELRLQQLVVQTYFHRRTNRNALGQPRSWTDNLLWHHAAHTVDLFGHQTAERVVAVQALQGPRHPELGIAMDLSVQLLTEHGSLCTLALSFNNDGPFGTTFRYICDGGTYLARYDDLRTGNDEPVDISTAAPVTDGVEAQDREFVAAISEGREPATSVGSVLDCYRVLGDLAATLPSD